MSRLSAGEPVPSWHSQNPIVSTIHEGGVALWSWNPHARTARLDALARTFWGVELDGEVPLDALIERIDARDRDEAREAWMASARSPGPYEFDFRVPDGDGVRWISARGKGGTARGDDVLAVFVDMTALHREREAQELLVAEMAHRIANLFSTAGAMAGIAAREAETVEAMADSLRDRFSALSGAYSFAVTRGHGGPRIVPVGEVVARLLEPYRADEERAARFRLDLTDETGVSARNITQLAMVVHELVTNAAKHGVLATPGGAITARSEASDRPDRVRIVWHEDGVRPPRPVSARSGFGTRMIDRTMRGTFGGEVARETTDTSYTVTLDFDRKALGAG